MGDFILKTQQKTKIDFYLIRDLKLSFHLPKDGTRMGKYSIK